MEYIKFDDWFLKSRKNGKTQATLAIIQDAFKNSDSNISIHCANIAMVRGWKALLDSERISYQVSAKIQKGLPKLRYVKRRFLVINIKGVKQEELSK